MNTATKIKMTTYQLPEPLVRLSGIDKIVSPIKKETLDNQLDEIFVRQFYKAGRRKKNMVILDIGANMGMASIYFKDWAKVIYALEPSPAAYQAMVENTKAFPQIKPFNLGIGDQRGKIRLIAAPGDFVPDSIMGKGDFTVDAPCVGLGEFMDDQKIDHVDLLKIDVEGSECWIFESKSFRDAAPKIDYIIGESHYFGDFTPPLMVEILKESGFKTKFLHLNNYYSRIDYTNANGEVKHYHIPYETMFVAKK